MTFECANMPGTPGVNPESVPVPRVLFHRLDITRRRSAYVCRFLTGHTDVPDTVHMCCISHTTRNNLEYSPKNIIKTGVSS